MKKAMIYAYTAANFGDDLFIYILCTRYKETQFYLYAPRIYQDIFQDLDNLEVIPNDTLPIKLLHRIPFLRYSVRSNVARKCDLAIYIGGSLFMEIKGWKHTLNSVKKMLSDTQRLFILGANFGPFIHQQFYDEYAQVFIRAKDVCFRDTYSSDLFQQIPQVRKGNDIVFSLQVPHEEKQQHTIIISVILPSARTDLADYDEIYFHAHSELAIKLMDMGYEIIWMAFCLEEGDLISIEHIRSLIPSKYKNKMNTWIYKGNLNEALQTIQSAKAVIATRFHALILSGVYKKPVYPVIYSDKMQHILDDCSFQGSYSNLRDIDKADPDQIIDAIHSRANILPDVPGEEKQFAIMDTYLDT